MCLLCNACASVCVLVRVCVLSACVFDSVCVSYSLGMIVRVLFVRVCVLGVCVWEFLFSMLTDNLLVYQCVNFCLHEPFFWCRAKNNDHLICHSSPLVLHLAFLSVNCSAEQKVRNRASVADRCQDQKGQRCQGKYNLEMFAQWRGDERGGQKLHKYSVYPCWTIHCLFLLKMQERWIGDFHCSFLCVRVFHRLIWCFYFDVLAIQTARCDRTKRVGWLLHIEPRPGNIGRRRHWFRWHCNTLQHTAKHCNTLQHTAMRLRGH